MLSSRKLAAHEMSALPMRPCEPMMMTRVMLIQHVTTLESRAQRVPVFWIHRHQRQPIFLLDKFHHRERGLHRRRVCLDEQILEERIILFVNPQCRRRLAGGK